MVALIASQAAFGATYSGTNYTLNVDDSFTFDGVVLSKSYSLTGTHLANQYGSIFTNLDNFSFNIRADDGYAVVGAVLKLYGTQEWTITNIPSLGSFNAALSGLNNFSVQHYDQFSTAYGTLPNNGIWSDSKNVDFLELGGDLSDITFNVQLSTNTYLSNANLAWGITGASFEFIVVQVPEPSSYALLEMGIGLIGAIARRKTKKESDHEQN